MKMNRWRPIVAATLTLVGLGLAFAAVFAVPLGLDTNSEWGPSRRLLLGVGLTMALAMWAPIWLVRVWQRGSKSRRLHAIGKNLSKGWERAARLPLVQKLSTAASASGQWADNLVHRAPIIRNLVATPYRTALSASLLVWAMGALVYVWIGSVGTWTHWPPTTSDFDLLAEGFIHGQLSLPVQPTPELLAMPDPYVMASRQYLPDLWDVSYYEGHFYLYWGPVPAVLLAALKLAVPIHVNDGLLTLFFTAGLSLMGILCLLAFWRRWPKPLPWWTILPPAMALSGATPVVWLLSRGAVYEVAIASGQFFFVAGLLAAVPALWGEPLCRRRLAAASALFALAVGCRLNLAPAALLILTLSTGVTLFAKRGRPTWDVRTLLAAGLPMLASAGLLAAYNWGRFGSWMEFGHRFQLGRWDMYHQYSKVFGLQNAIPNIYNYFFNGVHRLNVFPYLKPAWGQYYIWLTHSYAPDGYHTEKVAGVLVVFPFVWLAGLAMAAWARSVADTFERPGLALGWKELFSGRRGVHIYLIATVGALAAPLVSFVAVSMRHEVDFVPTLCLLAAVGFWQSYDSLTQRPLIRSALVGLAWLLTAATVIVALLLAMTGFQGNFETYNPGLFRHLTAFFSR